MLKEIQRSNTTSFVAFDLSTAFDNIDHKIFLHKLNIHICIFDPVLSF